MVSFNKKAISPVVATALLLVVAVVAVVGFQTWFNTYQTGLTGKAESQSASSVNVARLEYNTSSTAIIYLKGTGSSSVSTTLVEMYTESGTSALCSDTTSRTVPASGSGLGQSNVTSCSGIARGTPYKVVIYTADNVFQETAIMR